MNATNASINRGSSSSPFLEQMLRKERRHVTPAVEHVNSVGKGQKTENMPKDFELRGMLW